MRHPTRIPARTSIPQISAAIDFLPTLISFAGIDRVGDKPLDGRDLTPLLEGNKDAPWEERMIFSAWPEKTSVRTQTHRLDAEGRLYDLTTDPGQTKPLNKEKPDLAARLKNAVTAWKREMFGGKGIVRGAVDARPLPVGYPEFPVTMLPARDGEPSGGVKRSASAPNCSYFVHWKTREGKMTWNLDVRTAGKYKASIDYTCPEADAGSTIRLSFRDTTLDGKVAPGWDPPLLANQDTLPRPPAESTMKVFRTLKLGEIRLPAGEGELVLSAVDIPGASVMDVRRVTLELME